MEASQTGSDERVRCLLRRHGSPSARPFHHAPTRVEPLRDACL